LTQGDNSPVEHFFLFFLWGHVHFLKSYFWKTSDFWASKTGTRSVAESVPEKLDKLGKSELFSDHCWEEGRERVLGGTTGSSQVSFPQFMFSDPATDSAVDSATESDPKSWDPGFGVR